jgi:uncharacterized protein (DUF2236 family)
MFLFLGRFSTVWQFLFQNANNGVLVGVSDHKILKKSNIGRLYISFQWAANNVEVDIHLPSILEAKALNSSTSR